MHRLERIGILNEQEIIGQTGDQIMPGELSDDGIAMWKFMYDKREASGNYPRDIERSRLIAQFRENLSSVGEPIEACMMEQDHGYIQWLFPLDTMGVNPKAPILKENDFIRLSENENFRARLFEHFLLFVEFMGLQYNPDEGLLTKINANGWNNWILNPHNNLRISRILISLKNFGLLQVAKDFLEFLQGENNKMEPEVIGDQTFIPFKPVTRASCVNFWSQTLA